MRITKIGFYPACLLPLLLSACAGQAAPPSAGGEDASTTGKFISAPVRPPGAAPSPAPGDIAQSPHGARALAYLEQNSARYGIMDSAAELAFMNENTDALKQTHVRFQQMKNGVPVWGRQLIVHFDEHDAATSITGSFLSGLGRIDVQPHVRAEEAAATAEALKGEGWHAASNALCIYLHEFHPLLTYHVTLTRGLERWFVFVNARDGTVIHQVTGMPTAAP